MANVKISELSAVSSLSPTDVLPSVAGSTTSKITVQDLANSLTEVSSSISASYATTASFAISASWAPGSSPIDTSSFATTGSNNFTGNQHIETNLYVTGSSTFGAIAVRPDTTSIGGLVTLIDSTNGVLHFSKADELATFIIEISGSSLYGNNWPKNLIVSDPGLTILTNSGKTVDIGTNLNVTGSTTISNGNLRVQQDATDIGGGFFVSAASDYVTFAQQNSPVEFSIALSGSGLFPLGFEPTATRLYSTKGFEIVGSLGTKITGSVSISGSLSAPNITGSLLGTSSWAVSASWAPGGSGGPISVSGSTLYSNDPATSNFSPDNSIFLGFQAGQDATAAIYSNFIGYQAGYSSPAAILSNFLGFSAGWNSDNAAYSNFIGYQAGQSATNASYSNFLGWGAGVNASSASYSTFLGYKAGGTNSPSTNNIIIGTNVTLENSRKDSLNIGGIIFATGSYGTLTGNAFSGSMTDAKVGINKSLPQYTLDVSGSVGIATVLHITESDPLPAGTIGDLAVSASHLWFYNGTWAQLD